MGLILLIIVLIILLFYKRNIIKRLHNSFAQNSLKENTLDYIRNNWQKVCIHADHCDVMNENTTFDLHAVENNRMKSDLEETMLFTEAMLFNKSSSPVKVYQTTVADIDASVAQVKLNVQGYINVYYNPQNPKEVYVDTEFLQKDLSELMNH